MPSRTRTRFASPRPAACPAGDDARPDLWDLVDQVRAGDAEAFAELFGATVDTVHPYVLRRVLGDRDAAEEVTADIYLAAWRGIHGVRRVASSPVAWLRTIAQRRVIDHHRARQRRPHAFPAGSPAELADWRTGPVPTPSAESIYLEYLERARARVVWDHVRELTADQHQVIRYRFQYGLSIEETAAALGKPPTAVKALQGRAMRALRKRLAGSALDPRRAPASAAA